MQVTPHVYACHVDDGAVGHPGGSNNYFVGDPTEEMILIDTGQHDRSWTQQIIDYYESLGKPKITGIAITHGHADHYGGVDKVFDAMGEPEVRCHPKLTKTLETLVPKESIKPVRSREVLRTGGGAALRCIFTPGHAVDHVCFHFAGERVLFTGDTILGSSSATVSRPLSLHEVASAADQAPARRHLPGARRGSARPEGQAAGAVVHEPPEPEGGGGAVVTGEGHHQG